MKMEIDADPVFVCIQKRKWTEYGYLRDQRTGDFISGAIHSVTSQHPGSWAINDPEFLKAIVPANGVRWHKLTDKTSRREFIIPIAKILAIRDTWLGRMQEGQDGPYWIINEYEIADVPVTPSAFRP